MGAAMQVLEPQFEESELLVAGANSAQVKLLRVADRYRRPFAAMIYEPMVAAKATIDVSTLEMLFQMGSAQPIIDYLERHLAGAESPFRVAAKTKASTMILNINAAAGNATKCEFGGPVGGAAVEAERKIALQELEDAQEKLRRYYATHPGENFVLKPSKALQKLKAVADAARNKVMAFPEIQGTVAAPATPEAKKAAQAAYDKAMDKFLAYDDLHPSAKNDPKWKALNDAVQKAREKVIKLQTPISLPKSDAAVRRVYDETKKELSDYYQRNPQAYYALPGEEPAELLAIKKRADAAQAEYIDMLKGQDAAKAIAPRPSLPGGGTYTPAQQEALEDYVGSGYETINRDLRKKNAMTPRNTDITSQLDSMMVPAKKDTMVYRLVPEDRLTDLKAGDRFVDRAFLSTTKRADNFEEIVENLDYDGRDFNVVHIKVPKGTPGLDVNKAMATFKDLEDSGYAHEQEVILGRGRKFKVLRVESRREEGRLHIFLEVIK